MGLKGKCEKIDGSDGLSIWGEHERYIFFDAVRQQFMKFYPKLRTEIVPNANHFVQQDAPKATNAIIRDFLGSSSNYSCESLS